MNGHDRILVVKLADLGDVLLCEPAFRSLRAAFPTATIDVLVPPASAELVELLGLDLRPIRFPKHDFDDLRHLIYPSGMITASRLAFRLWLARYRAVVLLHHLTTSAGVLKFHALVAATRAGIVVGLDNGRGTFLTQRVTDFGFGVRHESEYMLQVARAAGGKDVDPTPRFPLDETQSDLRHLPAPYAVLFPSTGSYSSARTWPAQRYAALAALFESRGLHPVIVGAGDATPAARIILECVPSAVDMTGRTTIRELASIIARAEIVVGGDSFVGHLAAALDRPVVSIFGPSNVGAWKPVGRRPATPNSHGNTKCAVVRHALPCEPCVYTGFRLGRPNGCPDRTCMKRVDVDTVMAAVDDVLRVA